MSSRSSTTDRDELPGSILVGKVRKPHGVRGAVVVDPLSDVAARFAPGSRLTVVDRDRLTFEAEVESAAAHKGALLVAFVGFADRDAVEGLRGASLFGSREASPEAPEGAYYYYQLVGCLCRDSSGTELGRVVEVIEDGGGQLLRLDDGARGVLVPFVRSMLRSVDVEGRLIELDLPEGLVDTCAYRS